MAYVTSNPARPLVKSVDFFDPSKGYTIARSHPGRLTFKPKSRRGNTSLFLLYAGLGFLFFKLIVLFHMGASAYSEGLMAMTQGNAAQQVGARFLQVDPFTAYLRDMLSWFG